MKIGIDIRVLARGARTGVEEYTINLLSHLLGLDQNIEYSLFYNAWRKVKLNYPWLAYKNVQLNDFKIPNRFLFVSAKYQRRPKLDKLLGGVDLYFNPHFFNAPISRRCRKVVVFHDLSFERHPEYFSWRKRAWQKLLISAQAEAKRADGIIAVSESTKQDLIDLYQINPEKIKVIYSGVGSQFKPIKKIPAGQLKEIRRKYQLPPRFILYFGTIEPRKNLVNLIKAFEILRQKHQVKLVLAGIKGWLYSDIFKLARQSRYRDQIIFTGFVQEKDKPYLYNLAELFVYPSFFEGFGFPLLEAMACGRPAVTSHTSSLPEVAGRGGLMVDPYKIDELAMAMGQIISQPDLAAKLSAQGLVQAKKFSWSKSAQATLDFLSQFSN